MSSIPSALILCAAALVGCATGPVVRSNFGRTASLSNYRTFDFVSPAATDRGGYETLTTRTLKQAVQAELEARGHARTTASPDLLVNFHAVADRQNKISAFRSQRTIACEPGIGAYSEWAGYEPIVCHYDEGRLSIDVIDARQKRLAWEGAAIGMVNSRHGKKPDVAIAQATQEIYRTFPAGVAARRSP